MGVEGLRPYLQKVKSDVFGRTHISNFRGKRVAIDVAFWLHQNINRIYKPLAEKCELDAELNIEVPSHLILIGLFSDFIKFILIFIREGVTPLCVFDGAHPKLKEVKYARQQKLKDSYVENIQSYKNIILSQDYQLYTQEMRDHSRSRLKSLYCQRADVTKDDYEQIASWIRQLGLPYLCATSEAEGLASYLCIDGVVAAVYTKDTDTMVYGCPCTIFSMDQHGNAETMEITRVLEAISLPFPLFQDFCILCETDFNTRVPGFGPARIHAALACTQSLELFLLLTQKMYREHPSYATWFSTVATKEAKTAWKEVDKALAKDPECLNKLNIAENRDIFRYRKSSEEIKMGRLELTKMDPNVRSSLRMYGIENQIDELVALVLALPPPQNGERRYPLSLPN